VPQIPRCAALVRSCHPAARKCYRNCCGGNSAMTVPSARTQPNDLSCLLSLVAAKKRSAAKALPAVAVASEHHAHERYVRAAAAARCCREMSRWCPAFCCCHVHKNGGGIDVVWYVGGVTTRMLTNTIRPHLRWYEWRRAHVRLVRRVRSCASKTVQRQRNPSAEALPATLLPDTNAAPFSPVCLGLGMRSPPRRP